MDLEYDNGALYWKSSGKGRNNDLLAGYLGSGGYWFINVGGKMLKRSRLVYEMMVGPIGAGLEVDHENGVRHDDRVENLRTCTRSENLRNRRLSSNCPYKIHGVYYRKNRNKWYSNIEHDGKVYRLYYGDDFFEACCSRKSAERRLGFHENHGRTL